MEQFQYIYNNIKDNNEFVIIEKYGNNAKHFTIALISKKIFLLWFLLYLYFKFIIEPHTLLKPLYKIRNILNRVKCHTMSKLKCNTLFVYIVMFSTFLCLRIHSYICRDVAEFFRCYSIGTQVSTMSYANYDWLFGKTRTIFPYKATAYKCCYLHRNFYSNGNWGNAHCIYSIYLRNV